MDVEATPGTTRRCVGGCFFADEYPEDRLTLASHPQVQAGVPTAGGGLDLILAGDKRVAAAFGSVFEALPVVFVSLIDTFRDSLQANLPNVPLV